MEQDSSCKEILKQRMQEGLLHPCCIESDVRETNFERVPAEGITAGFPCQARYNVASKSGLKHCGVADGDARPKVSIDQGSFPSVGRAAKTPQPKEVWRAAGIALQGHLSIQVFGGVHDVWLRGRSYFWKTYWRCWARRQA